MRKQYTLEQKAQIMLEILKDEKKVAQIASEYGDHRNSPNKDIHVDYLNRFK